MTRLGTLRAVLALGIVTVAATASAGPFDRGDSRLPPKATVAPTPPPPPPPAKGWPHLLMSGTPTSCARNAAADEVIVYKDSGFAGSCASLKMGFYPSAQNLVVGNDAISSIRVGSAVRARAFKDGTYAGGWTTYAPGTNLSGLGAFDDKITSMRIEPGNRKDTCDDLQEGEFALFENFGFTGDCVVLPATESFANASLMGIENDSVSAIRNNSARKVNAFRDASFSAGLFVVAPHTAVNLPRDTTFVNRMDESISSVQTVDP